MCRDGRRYKRQRAENWEIGGLETSEVIVTADGRRWAAVGVEQDGKPLSTGRTCDMAFVRASRTAAGGRFTHVRGYHDADSIGGAFERPARRGREVNRRRPPSGGWRDPS